MRTLPRGPVCAASESAHYSPGERYYGGITSRRASKEHHRGERTGERETDRAIASSGFVVLLPRDSTAPRSIASKQVVDVFIARGRLFSRHHPTSAR